MISNQKYKQNSWIDFQLQFETSQGYAIIKSIRISVIYYIEIILLDMTLNRGENHATDHSENGKNDASATHSKCSTFFRLYWRKIDFD